MTIAGCGAVRVILFAPMQRFDEWQQAGRARAKHRTAKTAPGRVPQRTVRIFMR